MHGIQINALVHADGAHTGALYHLHTALTAAVSSSVIYLEFLLIMPSIVSHASIAANVNAAEHEDEQ